jgi:hypothetical protein
LGRAIDISSHPSKDDLISDLALRVQGHRAVGPALDISLVSEVDSRWWAQRSGMDSKPAGHTGDGARLPKDGAEERLRYDVGPRQAQLKQPSDKERSFGTSSSAISSE